MREFYKLVEFFGQFKLKKLRLVIGVPTFEKVLDKHYYKELRGGILEAVGKMFVKNMKLYIYPTIRPETNEIITSENLNIDNDIKHLYNFLKANKFILELESSVSKHLQIMSRDVFKMIKTGDTKWEDYVPMVVANVIKEKTLFGYKN
jgi:hypothetical protein